MSLFFSSDDILCFLSHIKLTPTKQVDNYCRRTILNTCLFIYVWKTLFQRHCVCVCKLMSYVNSNSTISASTTCTFYSYKYSILNVIKAEIQNKTITRCHFYMHTVYILLQYWKNLKRLHLILQWQYSKSARRKSSKEREEEVEEGIKSNM